MKTCAVLAVLCLSRIAAAEELVLDRTCVEIDPNLDSLAAPDRERATALLRRVLEREHQLVVTSGCSETYALSHELTDTGYVIRLRSAAGKRRMSTPALVDTSAKYTKLARSLLEAKAESTRAAATRGTLEAQPAAAELHEPVSPLPTAQIDDAEPEQDPTGNDAPAYKRNLWYTTLGGSLSGGLGWSLGYRRRFGSASLDLAAAGRSSDSGTEATTFGVEVLRNRQLSTAVTGYAGGGLSAGSMSRGVDYYGASYDYYWGEGIHGELTAGLHVGAARGIQLLAQLDITLPFYRLGNDQGQKDYAPTAVISGGFGF